MNPFEFFDRLNHKVREQYTRGQFSSGKSWRYKVLLMLFLVILFTMLFAIAEHNQL